MWQKVMNSPARRALVFGAQKVNELGNPCSDFRWNKTGVWFPVWIPEIEGGLVIGLSRKHKASVCILSEAVKNSIQSVFGESVWSGAEVQAKAEEAFVSRRWQRSAA